MNRKDQTVINLICENNINDLESFIRENSIDYRISSEDDDTLLLYAIANSDTEAWEWLLSQEANTKVLNKEGENLLHASVYSGELRRVRRALVDSDIDHQSNDGTTPLLLAVALEKLKIASYLIKQGANVNISDEDLNLPLHVASLEGHKLLVQEMIEAGSLLKAKTSKGNTPIALAANNDNDGIVTLLYNVCYKE